MEDMSESRLGGEMGKGMRFGGRRGVHMISV